MNFPVPKVPVPVHPGHYNYSYRYNYSCACPRPACPPPDMVCQQLPIARIFLGGQLLDNNSIRRSMPV